MGPARPESRTALPDPQERTNTKAEAICHASLPQSVTHGVLFADDCVMDPPARPVTGPASENTRYPTGRAYKRHSFCKRDDVTILIRSTPTAPRTRSGFLSGPLNTPPPDRGRIHTSFLEVTASGPNSRRGWICIGGQPAAVGRPLSFPVHSAACSRHSVRTYFRDVSCCRIGRRGVLGQLLCSR